MPPESRADYFKKRRETIGQFSVSVPRAKLDALTEVLKEKGHLPSVESQASV